MEAGILKKLSEYQFPEHMREQGLEKIRILFGAQQIKTNILQK